MNELYRVLATASPWAGLLIAAIAFWKFFLRAYADLAGKVLGALMENTRVLTELSVLIRESIHNQAPKSSSNDHHKK